MHGTFVFLIDDIDLDDITSTAECNFEHAFNSQLDENNFYKPMAVLLQDGTVINSVPKDDYRGRDGFAESIKKSIPDKSERWEWGLKFAIHCVALDMGLRGTNNVSIVLQNSEEAEKRKKIADMSYEETVEAINNEIPKALANAYANITITNDDKAFDQDGFIRRQTVKGFELFNNSTIKPFANYMDTPYNYRCFDLRQNSYGKELTPDTVMLFVDIHT